MDMICRFYHFVYYIYLFGQIVVGFGSFAVLGCKDLWNKANHLAKWYEHVMRCLELRSPCIIAQRSSASQIQAFNGPVV